MSFEQDLLAQYGGNRVLAATMTARSLMVSDPAAFKRGYSAENAVLAVQDLFGLDGTEVEHVRLGVEASA